MTGATVGEAVWRRIRRRAGVAALVIVALLLGYVAVVGVLRSRTLTLPAPGGPHPVGRIITTVAAGDGTADEPPGNLDLVSGRLPIRRHRATRRVRARGLVRPGLVAADDGQVLRRQQAATGDARKRAGAAQWRPGTDALRRETVMRRFAPLSRRERGWEGCRTPRAGRSRSGRSASRPACGRE